MEGVETARARARPRVTEKWRVAARVTVRVAARVRWRVAVTKEEGADLVERAMERVSPKTSGGRRAGEARLALRRA